MKPSIACALAAIVEFVAGVAVCASDTSFSYQGELIDSGNLAAGSYAMEFSLWDALVDGNQIGGVQTQNNIDVVDGRFTVELDFGADNFGNDPRWLQIEVNGTTLSPRHPITGAPYSIQTHGIFVNDDATFVGIGRQSAMTSAEAFGVHSPLATAGSYGGTYVSTASQQALPFYGYAAGGDADMWHYYDGATGKWHLFNNGDRLTVDGDGHVGVGTASPQSPLHVASSSSIIYGVIFAEQASTSVNIPAVYGRTMGEFGIGVHGKVLSDTGFNAGVRGDSFSDAGAGVWGRAFSDSGTNYGVMGSTESSAGYDFFANGAGVNYGAASSIRWKRNIQPIADPLAMLGQLRGVFYDWDEQHGGKHDIGMIAEEVGRILPEIVQYEPNGIDAIGMDYSMLTPLLVEAVNALRSERDAEIATLRAEKDEQIQQLTQQVSELRNLITQNVAIRMENSQ